jgi:lysophospholipase L1-like esterase
MPATNPAADAVPAAGAPDRRSLPLRAAAALLRGLAALAVALLLLEGALRLLGFGLPQRGPNNRLPLRIAVPPDQAPGLHDTLRPSSSGSVLYPGYGEVPDRTVDYRINRDGFRDRPESYARPKPADTYRIVCLGDSVTYGTGVQLEQTFPKLLEQRFAAAATPCRVEVMNCAVFAHNTSQQVAWFELQVAQFDPDLVLVTSTIPDASGKNVVREERPPTPAARWIQRLGLTSGVWAEGDEEGLTPAAARTMFLRRHSVLADLVAHTLYNRLMSTAELANYRRDWEPGSPGSEQVRRALARLAELARSQDFELRVAMFPVLEDLDESHPFRGEIDVFRGICAELGLPFLDLLEPLLGRHGPALRAHPHDHHPNPQAHALVAAALGAWLDPVVCGGR